jgi:pyruvyltransferase
MEHKKLKSVCLKFYQEYPNAGDQFSFALAKRYFSENVIPSTINTLTVPNLILVGSYLIKSDAYSHICGAGFIATDTPWFQLSTAPKSIHCVRGPLTAELLEKQGIHCPKIYADPGILAPELFPRSVFPKHKIGVIPHFLDVNLPWIESCRAKGISIIDASSPLDKYFSDIHGCEIILSSSLHGIIFAHAYGIPALWIELSDNVIGNGFKFYDYYLSLGIQCEKVRRVRVNENTDPYEIAKLATVGDQSTLIAPLKEAMFSTIKQLRRDQMNAGIKNILMPLNFHNRKKFVKKLNGYFKNSKKQ